MSILVYEGLVSILPRTNSTRIPQAYVGSIRFMFGLHRYNVTE